MIGLAVFLIVIGLVVYLFVSRGVGVFLVLLTVAILLLKAHNHH